MKAQIHNIRHDYKDNKYTLRNRSNENAGPQNSAKSLGKEYNREVKMFKSNHYSDDYQFQNSL